MNILFVCKYNRFRSQVAEWYFKKINKNKKIKVASAGLFYDKPIGNIIKQIGKKNNFAIKGEPKQVNTKLLKWQNIIVIVANDVPKSLFRNWKRKKIIVWKISDMKVGDSEELNKIVRLIMKKVDGLVKQLEMKHESRYC